MRNKGETATDRGNNARGQRWKRKVGRIDGKRRQERKVEVADWKENRSKTKMKMKKKDGAR